MQRYDAEVLARNLNALTEVFEKKPVSAKALEVWFDTLKEFPTDRVMGVLISWPKGHTKFPAPSEVWKSCNDRSIDEREEKAAKERVENTQQPFVRSERGLKFLAEIKAILARPKRSAKEHWRYLLATKPKDSIGYRYATEALAALEPKRSVVEREPGQDDEELAA